MGGGTFRASVWSEAGIKLRRCVDLYGIDEIIIAIPSASREQISSLLEICKETKLQIEAVARGLPVGKRRGQCLQAAGSGNRRPVRQRADYSCFTE